VGAGTSVACPTGASSAGGGADCVGARSGPGASRSRLQALRPSAKRNTPHIPIPRETPPTFVCLLLMAKLSSCSDWNATHTTVPATVVPGPGPAAATVVASRRDCRQPAPVSPVFSWVVAANADRDLVFQDSHVFSAGASPQRVLPLHPTPLSHSRSRAAIRAAL
jgi:hypothetical protein